MRTQNNLKDFEVELLKTLIGCEYQVIAGPDLWHFLSATKFIIKTDKCSIEISGNVTSLDFEGFEDDYSTLSVAPASEADMLKSHENGNVYVFHSGKQIIDVKIFRETLSEIDPGVSDWIYSTDVAIMLVFADSNLVISKLNHHTELLQATFNELEASEFPSPRDGFVEDITKTQSVTYQSFSLSGWGDNI